MSEFKLSDKVKGINLEIGRWEYLEIEDIKEFIKRRLERIDLIINLYPHKSGKELAGELKEDLLNDVKIKIKWRKNNE